MYIRQRGFNLVELTVAIAVIALISSIVLANMSSTREKSKIKKEIVQIQELKKAAQMYYLDTRSFVPVCSITTCNASNDPLLTAPSGVRNWKGPYLPNGTWSLAHQWGGHITVAYGPVSGLTGDRHYVFLNEDAPRTTGANNSGVIPTSALLQIDAVLDDGNLSTGNLRGDGGGFGAVTGEVVYVFNL